MTHVALPADPPPHHTDIRPPVPASRRYLGHLLPGLARYPATAPRRPGMKRTSIETQRSNLAATALVLRQLLLLDVVADLALRIGLHDTHLGGVVAVRFEVLAELIEILEKRRMT